MRACESGSDSSTAQLSCKRCRPLVTRVPTVQPPMPCRPSQPLTTCPSPRHSRNPSSPLPPRQRLGPFSSGSMSPSPPPPPHLQPGVYLGALPAQPRHVRQQQQLGVQPVPLQAGGGLGQAVEEEEEEEEEDVEEDVDVGQVGGGEVEGSARVRRGLVGVVGVGAWALSGAVRVR